MYLTNEKVREYCLSILDNLGKNTFERDELYGGTSVSGREYYGYGLYIGQKYEDNTIRISFEEKSVFRSDVGVIYHGGWEQVLFELWRKAPTLAETYRLKAAKKRRKIENWKSLGEYLERFLKYLPMETTRYEGPTRSVVTSVYVDNVVKVIQEKVGWENPRPDIRVYVSEIIEENRWYGKKKIQQYKLVFDNHQQESFIDGDWHQYLIDIIKAWMAKKEVEENERIEISAQNILNDIKNI